jgi:predicted RecA/RadA family phage recombinase
MANNFVTEGKILNWPNGTGSAVSSGEVVVIGDLVGVALVDIADGESGSVQISEVFTLTKTAGTAWNQGDKLDFDVSASAFDKGITPAAGDVTGCAVAYETAASAATSGKVLLTPGTGTVN